MNVIVLSPHERRLDTHPIASHSFNITLSSTEAYVGEIKRRGVEKSYYIDVHLNREQAVKLLDELTEFLRS